MLRGFKTFTSERIHRRTNVVFLSCSFVKRLLSCVLLCVSSTRSLGTERELTICMEAKSMLGAAVNPGPTFMVNLLGYLMVF